MKGSLDKATLGGFALVMIAMLGSIILEGGSPFTLINTSAALLVFGGTIGAGMVSFPLPVVRRIPKLMMLAFREPKDNANALVEQFVTLAERARKEGLLALEQEAATIAHPMLKKGIMFVVDGTDPELVKSMLEIEVSAREQRHEVGIGLFEALGGFAPTLGILGTVMGMIHILSKMESATKLAVAISVAFTATLYGVASANLLWLPIANKLKRRTADEAEAAYLIIDGVAAIQAGDNPRIVREKLAGYIAPAKGKGKKNATESDASAGTPANRAA